MRNECLWSSVKLFIPPAAGSFLEQFFLATKELGPEARGSYLEDPPAGAMNIEDAHQVMMQDLVASGGLHGTYC